MRSSTWSSQNEISVCIIRGRETRAHTVFPHVEERPYEHTGGDEEAAIYKPERGPSPKRKRSKSGHRRAGHTL